jgi:hypothetical protein
VCRLPYSGQVHSARWSSVGALRGVVETLVLGARSEGVTDPRPVVARSAMEPFPSVPRCTTPLATTRLESARGLAQMGKQRPAASIVEVNPGASRPAPHASER